MILAAGLGTRLGDIGRDTPKALLEVGGATMLERAARTLVEAGAHRLIVNAHHHAERIAEFVVSTDLGAATVLSIEEERPLETGGGLLHARHLFTADEPFFLYNVDIVTDADLSVMYGEHCRGRSLASLATSGRASSRRLLFDDAGLFGRIDERTGLRVEARQPRGAIRERAFSGIHVVSPAIFELIEERGAFPILDPYVRLAGAGHRIDDRALDDGALWMDIGTPSRLDQARRHFSA